MSGSCLNIALIHDAKVIPAFALTCDWFIPSNFISTGSSIVVIFTSSLFKLFNTEYNVVVLPDPVGPDVKIIPFGQDIIFLIFSISSFEAPTSLISLSLLLKLTAGANILITTFSFPLTGNVFIRKSEDESLYFIEKVPS